MRSTNRQVLAMIGVTCGILAWGGTAWSQAAEPGCRGTSVTVQRGDSLSRIAERCDVSEGAILAANPGVDGSGDLQVGETLRLRRTARSGQSLGSRLKDFGERANDAVGRVADSVGASVEDLLDRNPDLKSRLDSLGQTIGLTDRPNPAISVTPDSGPPGASITISATGLPGNVPVTVGAGAPARATEAIARARTSDTGTMTTHLTVPDWTEPGSSILFTIRTERGLRARSERFRVTR